MILLALGANMPSSYGNPAATLRRVLLQMPAHKISVVKVSAFYQTPAWPDPSDPPFVNAVVAVETSLDPQALLTVLHQIEADFGRLRSYSNAPRTLDLDLIDYDGRVEEGWPLLPHPRAHQRAFVLIPLADIAPDWKHPVLQQSLTALLAALPHAERDAVIALP